MLLAPRFSTDPQFRAPLTLYVIHVEAQLHNLNHSSLKGSSAERGDLSYMILYACDRRRRTRAHIHIVSQTGVGGWALRHSPYPKAAYVGFQPHVRRNAKNHAKNAYKIVSSGRDARPGVRDRVYTILTHNLILDRIEQYYITNSPNTTFVALSTYHSADRM